MSFNVALVSDNLPDGGLVNAEPLSNCDHRHFVFKEESSYLHGLVHSKACGGPARPSGIDQWGGIYFTDVSVALAENYLGNRILTDAVFSGDSILAHRSICVKLANLLSLRIGKFSSSLAALLEMFKNASRQLRELGSVTFEPKDIGNRVLGNPEHVGDISLCALFSNEEDAYLVSFVFRQPRELASLATSLIARHLRKVFISSARLLIHGIVVLRSNRKMIRVAASWVVAGMKNEPPTRVSLGERVGDSVGEYLDLKYAVGHSGGNSTCPLPTTIAGLINTLPEALLVRFCKFRNRSRWPIFCAHSLMVSGFMESVNLYLASLNPVITNGVF